MTEHSFKPNMDLLAEAFDNNSDEGLFRYFLDRESGEVLAFDGDLLQAVEDGEDPATFASDIADEVAPSAAGHMASDWWLRIPSKFPDVLLDAMVVMPNHLHAVVLLERERENSHGAGAHTLAQSSSKVGGQTRGSAPTTDRASVTAVAQWFKTMTTNAYFRGVKAHDWPAVRGRLWQRNYYEHIIRDDTDLNHVRDYIAGNPAAWPDDDENPARRQPPP